ncbi:glycosyltransferase [Verrucomicrobiota bacterium sgz303538]
MKICDLTQFYSPVSGGVKRYVAEKVRYMRTHSPGDEHILIIPGEEDSVESGKVSRLYTIRSPLISKTSRYRVLLRLEAIERILEREKPDIIESGDPYQVAWKAVHSGSALGIPVVGFYHSHFPEAYLRSAQKFLGATATEFILDLSRRYIRNLYNRFERTLVPSPALGEVLEQWGVRNIAHTDLGVNTEIFRPHSIPQEDVREELGIPRDRTLLLYVGRLAFEKNTQTLFAAFRQLVRREPGRFHLLIVGDGLQRTELEQLRTALGGKAHAPITWFSYCRDSERLAALYRAADLFVHPGVQETFGLVTLEAQACGTPVIGIRGSYMDRIIHFPQTHWADANTPEALATAISEMSRADLVSWGREAAATVAARYSWNSVFGRLFDLYREIIANYQHP